MRKNKADTKNFLEAIPVRAEDITWSVNEENIVTLAIENKGIFNKIAQKLFKKPKISYIHLDEMGSFVWPIIDGQANLIEIGKKVEEHFGEKANPLYERLAKYFKILESYGFIKFIKN